MANKPSEIIKNAKKMITDGYVYVYGYKGSKVTKKEVKRLAKLYPSVFTSTILSLALKKAGKIGIDCSGFVCKAAGISHIGSSQIYSSATSKWSVNDLSHVKNGCFIWRSGHVGLIEIDSNGQKWILEAQGTAYDLKRTKFENRYKAFTHYGYIPGVDYSSATIKKTTTTTSSKTTTMKVNTNGSALRCRKKGSITSSIVGRFKNGTKVTVLKADNPYWYKVEGISTNGTKIRGYVSRKYLKLV